MTAPPPNHILKFPNDTAVLGMICVGAGGVSACREEVEVQHMVTCCDDNNLERNKDQKNHLTLQEE